MHLFVLWQSPSWKYMYTFQAIKLLFLTAPVRGIAPEWWQHQERGHTHNQPPPLQSTYKYLQYRHTCWWHVILPIQRPFLHTAYSSLGYMIYSLYLSLDMHVQPVCPSEKCTHIRIINHSAIVLNLRNFNFNKLNYVTNISVPDYEFPHWPVCMQLLDMYQTTSRRVQERNIMSSLCQPRCCHNSNCWTKHRLSQDNDGAIEKPPLSPLFTRFLLC